MSSPSDASDSPQSAASNTNKRKAKGPPADSHVKRRAARACLRCRNRKVRCDVTSGGVPCNNCRLDDAECLLVETNRGKARPSSNWNEPRPSIAEAEGEDVEDFPVTLTFEGSRRLADSRLGNTNDGVGALVSPVTAATRASFPTNDNQGPLPRYIRPLPAHLDAEDVGYLTRKGALTLPDEELQCALLRAYIQFVQAYMPVLDLAPVYTAIAQRGEGAEPVSLILVQAIMFAAVAYVDIDYLTARGFSSRKEARRVFFNRVRLLYGLECETDRMTLLQALILMTYWYENPEDEKETWYWLGIALSLAQILGLHRDPEQLDISPAERKLRKRIWWCCFMRDRLLALGLRRPIRLRPDDFNVPMLTFDDLEVSPFNDDVVRWLGPLFMMDDTQGKKTLGIASIELAKLCEHIGQVLSTQYSVVGVSGDRTLNVMVVPKKSPESTRDLPNCDTALAEWLQRLDSSCAYGPSLWSSAGGQTGSQRILYLHLALLHMIYFTTITALHRPQAFHSSLDATEAAAIRLSKDKVTEAAVRITEMVDDLSRHDSLRYASTSSITAILSATTTHLVNLRSENHDIRSISIGRFYQCWHALQQLRDIYAAADHAVWFLEAVIKRTKVNIPMLNIAGAAAQPTSAHHRSRTMMSGHCMILDSPQAQGQGPVENDVIVVNNAPAPKANGWVSQSDLAVDRPNSSSAPLPIASPSHTSSRFAISQNHNGEAGNSFHIEDDILQTLMQFDANSTSLNVDGDANFSRWDS